MVSVFDKLNEIDAVLGVVDREIWIITASDGGRRGGLVATWVSATSIDRERPVLLAGIAPNHFTAELVQGSKAFAAHLLRPDQGELAWNFACDSGRSRDKLAGLVVATNATGAPVLADCLAWFECRVFARYDAGDRLFYWADVVDGSRSVPTTHPPLRERAFFDRLSAERRQVLAAAREADAEVLQEAHQRWRSINPW